MIKNLSLKPRDILCNRKIVFFILILFITIAHFNIEIEQIIKKIKNEDWTLNNRANKSKEEQFKCWIK